MDEEINRFRNNLYEAATWCLSKVSLDDPKDSLRKVNFDYIIKHKSYGERFNNIENLYRIELIESLITERRSQLENEKFFVLNSLDSVRKGKILAYFPQWSISDAVSTPASREFFDEDNNPAWDTWFYYKGAIIDFRDTKEDAYILFCWIPPIFIDLVDDGISVNAEESIKWATDVKSDFTSFLKRYNLLF